MHQQNTTTPTQNTTSKASRPAIRTAPPCPLSAPIPEAENTPAEAARSQCWVSITEFASAPSQTQGESLWFYLQDIARQILPEHRLQICFRFRRPDFDTVDVIHSEQRGRAHYNGLMRCGNRYVCPPCSNAKTESDRRDLTAALDDSRSRYLPIMITYTLRHKYNDGLTYLADRLLAAFRVMKSGRSWQTIKDEYFWAGSVRSLEVTHGLDYGWHPHIHELAFLDLHVVKAGFSPELLAGSIQTAITREWLRALEKVGLSAGWFNSVDVRATYGDVENYVAKFGKLPAVDDSGWTLEKELTKGLTAKQGRRKSRSPFQLLWLAGQGDPESVRLFQEYAAAMKGRSQLQWSRGLRELLNLGDELAEIDKLNESAPDDWTMAKLDYEQWRVVLNNGARGGVLAVAGRGDLAALWDYLDRLPGMEKTTAHYLPPDMPILPPSGPNSSD